MFGKQVTLFTLFGFTIRVDMSWAFLAVLIAWSLAEGFFPAYYTGLPKLVYWWMGLGGVVGLFISIVLHELSHSLVARQFGIPIHGITLFIFGGVAEMEEEPLNPGAEFLMAVAGPVTSLVLAALFYGLSAGSEALNSSAPVIAVTRYLAFLNALLATFNLLPAFPLDGGRVLRAALWRWKGDLRQATRISCHIGSGFGVVLVALGIFQVLTGNFLAGIWWSLIGLFLRGAATASYRQLMARRALHGVPVRALMIDKPISVMPGLTIRELLDHYIYTYHFDMFPVTRDSHLVGCVQTRQIKEVPRERWDSVTVGEIAEKCSPENTVSANDDAVNALAKMQRAGASRLMVVDSEQQLIGIITLKDMLKLFALKMDLEARD